MIENIEHTESEKPSRAEMEAAAVRLAAAVREMRESAAALEAAHLRVEAALQELKASTQIAHRLLYPPASYN